MPKNTNTTLASCANGLDGFTASYDAGAVNPGASAKIFPQGTQPANPDQAEGATELVEFDFGSTPLFGSSTTSGDNATATSTKVPVQALVSADGLAGWMRVYDRNGVAVSDHSIGQSGGGNGSIGDEDILFDDINFSIGDNVTLTGFQLTKSRLQP